MLCCEECRCVSDTGKGRLAFIAEDRDGDEPPEIATYCPPCADRELRPVDHAAATAERSECRSRELVQYKRRNAQ